MECERCGTPWRPVIGQPAKKDGPDIIDNMERVLMRIKDGLPFTMAGYTDLGVDSMPRDMLLSLIKWFCKKEELLRVKEEQMDAGCDMPRTDEKTHAPQRPQMSAAPRWADYPDSDTDPRLPTAHEVEVKRDKKLQQFKDSASMRP